MNFIIILTENSLYIVSGKIQKRKVNLASLQEAYDAFSLLNNNKHLYILSS